jgi:hypothetical protein
VAFDHKARDASDGPRLLPEKAGGAQELLHAPKVGLGQGLGR